MAGITGIKIEILKEGLKSKLKKIENLFKLTWKREVIPEE